MPCYIHMCTEKKVRKKGCKQYKAGAIDEDNKMNRQTVQNVYAQSQPISKHVVNTPLAPERAVCLAAIAKLNLTK